ncbi:helix-turn-helix transcriptional regulator, partial [Mycobacterium sp. 1423905.2]|uniref:helix-turn-helix transcriptional regulator n=1 Tax=Mycobacterium sp. 1423905.2 TaxID=1856859 RepID=UPI00080081B6
AANRSARLIVTIRSGEPVLDAVTALMKERLLLTVHIDPFTRVQTGELASAVLGGSVERRLINELYDRSAGNLLVLRGLLCASRQKGVLAPTTDGWRIRGPLQGDRELYDLLRFRLRSLAADELEVVEVLATAEVLEWEILRSICDADAVARLERRAMIELVADGSQTLAQLNPPILGEAALLHAGTVRSRELNGMLAQAIQDRFRSKGQTLKVPDVRCRIRLAQFIVRSDLVPDLDVVMEAAAEALAMSNVALGEELARFAYDRRGGPPAGMLLAEALGWQGRGEEAETVLLDAQPDPCDGLALARWGSLRAANLFWNCGDVDAAAEVLADVKRHVSPEAGAQLVNALEVTMAFFSGDIATTLQRGSALCASDLPPTATVWAAVPTCAALATTGRCADVDRMAAAALRAAAVCGRGLQRFNVGMAEIMAATATGDYRAAEQVHKRYAVMAAGVPGADALIRAMRGFVEFARGNLPSACAAFNDAKSALSQGFSSPWFVLMAARHAQAEAARGDSAAAAAAVRRTEKAYGPHVAVFMPELELARAWERASVGEMTVAQAHAVRAAHITEAAGMHAAEMHALHTAVRFSDRSHANRLGELAEILNTPIARAVADHARGLADNDAGLIDAAAAQFADLGAVALAADASAQAAVQHARVGNRGKQIESSTQASSLARRYGLRTPAVKAAGAPLPLSGREREVAALVVAGLSNRQIAERLVVSVRTVEGHLYRLFTKLGINNRDQLIRLLNCDAAG